ncbi:unnamed protein product [Caenorhabditis auriculariae]|uniref:Thyroglobulin type-1 domain-containing protein n=1 Tax=Caenorhabditis auriculariae TaxID=2777116 RepID=A0A8S1HX44_9PELO|nr:unnamed protein product [Caenorhabditis auriculariae]
MTRRLVYDAGGSSTVGRLLIRSVASFATLDRNHHFIMTLLFICMFVGVSESVARARKLLFRIAYSKSFINTQRKVSDVFLDISEAQELQTKQLAEHEARLDCASQRKKALLRKDAGDIRVYVPDCSTTNPIQYQRTQCYELTHYCWCVHEISGEPVAGSTTQNGRPGCAAPATQAPKKKRKNRCKGNRRTRFLRRVVATIKAEMILAGVNQTKTNRDAVLQWKFKQLDLNDNKLLERQEWKPYKAILLEWRKARHCSRNLFKTCDVDANRRLTPEEWRKCIAQEVNLVPATRPEQLNPFLYILKPE